MDYTHLGRSGLSVSRLCLGTMNFGPHTDEADTPLDHGRRARRGHQLLRHRQRLRRGREPRPHRGDRRHLVRQRRRPPRADGDRHQALRRHGRDWPNNGKLSALNIRRALDASLKRLQTDYIDLYQFHHVDRATPWEEIWQAMEVAVAQGKILYVGSSNFAGWHIAQAQAAAADRHFTGLVSEQSIYNLLVRDIELEVIPAAAALRARHHPLVAAARRPARRRADARATRAYAGSRAGPRTRWRSTATRSQAYEDLAVELGVEPAELGLAWLLHQPAVTAPIVGPRIAEQLDGALKAVGPRARPGDAGPAGRDLPGPQDGAGGLRLVGPDRPARLSVRDHLHRHGLL